MNYRVEYDYEFFYPQSGEELDATIASIVSTGASLSEISVQLHKPVDPNVSRQIALDDREAIVNCRWRLVRRRMFDGTLHSVEVMSNPECLLADLRAFLDSWTFTLDINSRPALRCAIHNVAGGWGIGRPPSKRSEKAVTIHTTASDTARVLLVNLTARKPFFVEAPLTVTVQLSGVESTGYHAVLVHQFTFRPGSTYSDIEVPRVGVFLDSANAASPELVTSAEGSANT